MFHPRAPTTTTTIKRMAPPVFSRNLLFFWKKFRFFIQGHQVKNPVVFLHLCALTDAMIFGIVRYAAF